MLFDDDEYTRKESNLHVTRTLVPKTSASAVSPRVQIGNVHLVITFRAQRPILIMPCVHAAP